MLNWLGDVELEEIMKKRKTSTLSQAFCQSCGSDGFFKLADSLDEQSILLQCSNCSTLVAEVWCPNCKMGGQLAEADLESHSSHWNCIECGKRHEFPKDFYKKAIVLRARGSKRDFLNTLNYLNPIHVPYKWLKKEVKDFKKEGKFYIQSFFLLSISGFILINFKIAFGVVPIIFSLIFIFTYLLFNILYWSICQYFYIVARIKNKDKN